MPQVRWTSVSDFFADVEAVADQLPHYRGELYLERHRGTATSQSDHKRAFRDAEKALQLFEAVQAVLGGAPQPYRWDPVLLASFHDAIPGSSIRDVYEEITPRLHQTAQCLRAESSEALSGETDEEWFHPIAVASDRVLEMEGGRFQRIRFPALGTGTDVASDAVDAPEWKDRELRNARVRARFDKDGRMRELILDGNDIPMSGSPACWIHPDHPSQHDAWEVELHDLANGKEVEVGPLQLCTEHSLRVEVAQELSFQDERLGQLIWGLDAGSDGLDVRVEVDWTLPHRWLRFEVPTDFQGRFARFGGPFGASLRPQWPGNEQETAMWEGTASRWAAVTDDASTDGLALITEAKYGMHARSGALSLSLLRAPTNPDPDTDMGFHRMRFQLRPWRTVSEAGAPVPALAAEIQYATPCPSGRTLASPWEWENLNSLVPSWVAPSATVPGAMILRAHEVSGRNGEAVLRFIKKPASLVPVDLLENPLPDSVPVDTDHEGRVSLPFTAYSIHSYLISWL
jgi:alpha-mannosidase